MRRILIALLAAVFAIATSPINAQIAGNNSGISGNAVSNTGLDTWNVLTHGLTGNCSTNERPALLALLTKASAAASATSRTRLIFPTPPGGCYAVTSSVEIPSNVELEPVGNVIIRQTSAASPTGNGAIFTITNHSNIRVGAFTLDQQKTIHTSIAQAININGSSEITLDHVKIVNPSGSIVAATSHNLHILAPDVQNGLFHGVLFNGGVYDSEVLDGTFQSNVGFGVILAGVNYRNRLSGNHTTSNGIELIGITYGSYQNIVTGNHAEGTGDNCISITGHENTIANNVVIGCAGNGIHIYGDRNTVTGNYAKNNSQLNGSNSAWRAGIAVEQGFGGMGQYNVITGNVTDDDQVTPTQQYGVWIAPASYAAWITSHSYTSGSSYVFNGLNLYLANTTGTSGASAPTCTSGTCSDGTITWQYVSTFAAGDTLNDRNVIHGNNSVHQALSAYLDASGASNNEVIGGFNALPLPSALQASSIGNAGSVTSITPVAHGSYSNGTTVTLTVAPPTSGTQATATPVYTILGFGSLATGGSGCSVNDVLSVVGGTFSSTGDAIKVLTVDGSGVVLTFTGIRFNNYTVLPSAGNTTFTGGTCTVQPTLTGTVWQIGSVTVTGGGGGYTIAPTVTGSSGSPTFTVGLSSSFTVSGGSGVVTLDSNGVGLSGPIVQTGGAASLTGTATNDSAGAGLIGQIITSSVPVASASALSTGAAANMTSISLTAGDWDVDAVVAFHPAATTSVTSSSGGINATSATIPLLSTGASAINVSAAQVPNGDYSVTIPPTRISLSVTTTIFMVASSTFTVSTNAGYGFIRARRVR